MKSNWARLSETLVLRRRLQASLRPVKNLGSRSGPAPWQPYSQWEREIKAKRKKTRASNRELWKLQGLKGVTSVKKRIAELMKEEERLWKKVRPDLYPDE